MASVNLPILGSARDHIGNVQQYLLSRRGQLINLEVRDDYARLIEDVFLESMFDHISNWRCQTAEKEVFSMEFKRYWSVLVMKQEQLIATA